MFIEMAKGCDEAPSGRDVNIALLTELVGSIASVTINITLLTELASLIVSLTIKQVVPTGLIIYPVTGH